MGDGVGHVGRTWVLELLEQSNQSINVAEMHEGEQGGHFQGCTYIHNVCTICILLGLRPVLDGPALGAKRNNSKTKQLKGSEH